MAQRLKRYVVKPLADEGGYYYEQKGANGKVLNVSESYTRRRDAVRGILDANPEPRNIQVTHEYEEQEEMDSA